MTPAPVAPPGWPTFDRTALHGPIGQIVEAVEAETESDPAGLLLTGLTLAGASIGSGPHAIADSMQHPAKLYSGLVGATGSSRKTTTLAVMRPFLAIADEKFTRTRFLGGFGSGESVVDAVRDPDPEHADLGADDCRAVILETELGRQLRIMGREGSTLSPTARALWDGPRAEARSRARTSVASNAQVALLGHITGEELRKHLTDLEIAAGFGNRVLWYAVRRQRLLPDGGSIDAEWVQFHGRKLGEAICKARTIGRVHRDQEASRRWAELYQRWADEEEGGIVGALLAPCSCTMPPVVGRVRAARRVRGHLPGASRRR
jgi:hypothetical protein